MTQRPMELGDESSKERFEAENGYEQDGRIETDKPDALHRSKSRLQSSLSPLTSQHAQLQSIEARPPD